MIKANPLSESIASRLARIKNSRARIISLVVLTLFLSGFQEVRAQALVEVDIASMKACPISQREFCSPFGNPHPCFPNGTSLKIAIPKTRENSAPIEIILNGEAVATSGLEFLSIPRYQIGINLIEFFETSQQDGQRVAISSTKFIIYKPAVTRMRTFSVP